MMGAVDKFLHQLIKFDKEHIPAKVIAALKPYLDVCATDDISKKRIIAATFSSRTLNSIRKKYWPSQQLPVVYVLG